MSVSLPLISALQAHAASTRLVQGPVAPRSPKADPAEEFEAFVLQSFIQEMLPKDSEAVFGGGLSGDIWRSLLSEKMAGEFARQSPLGIAEQVRSDMNARSRPTAEALGAVPLLPPGLDLTKASERS